MSWARSCGDAENSGPRSTVMRGAAPAGTCSLGPLTSADPRSSRGAARHDRTDDGRNRPPLAIAPVLDGEAGGLDQLDRRAVAAAALGKSLPRLLEAVLPRRQPRRLGPHVLEEQQAAARSQHALDLLEDD